VPSPRPGEGPGAEVLGAALLELAPRVVVEGRGVVWADGRGLPASRLAAALLERLDELGLGEGAGAGVALTPAAAEAAARVAARERERARARERERTAASVRSRGTRTEPHTANTPARSSPAVPPPGRRGDVGRPPGWKGRAEGAPPPSPAVQGRGPGWPPPPPPAVQVDGPGGGAGVVVVGQGRDREFLAPLPLAVLDPDEHLAALLEGVGLERCGELAALDREAVEVRFGPEGVALWRRARAEDARPLFGRVPPERPRASLDFVDYVLTDPARLVFTANALLGGLCEGLRARGEHARRMTLALPLANGQTWRCLLRPARPTASRAAWLRLIRTELERLSVPDAVTGVALEVGATEPAAVRQGDLFDHGFATAEAVEQAVARLIEAQGDVVVRPASDAHPLAERRTRWVALEPTDAAALPAPGAARADGGARGAAGATSAGTQGGAPGARAGRQPGRAEAGPTPPVTWDGDPAAAHLTLQLLAEPRRIRVETVARRDHHVPVRYRDGRGVHELVTAAGPDRVSGERWGDAYAREYFRCVTADGVLVWLFRDARTDEWYLQGWWD